MLKHKKILLITKFILICCILFPILPAGAEENYASGYEIIIDNSQTTSGFTCTGGWKTADYDDAYNGTAKVINTSAVNAEKAKWTPDIPTAGYYRAYMTWPQTENAAESAGVQVHSGGGYDYNAKKINQNRNAGCWVEIGTYYFTEGRSNYIALKPDADGYVTADAVKLVLSQPTDGLEPFVMDNVTAAVDYNENETVIAQDRSSGEFYLSVGGEPFYINGVCKSEGMDKIKAAGGNTVRTYSALIANNTTKAILDTAEGLGMKVVLGLAMPKENETFNYTDNYEDFFNGTSFSNLKKQIDAFKNHPALLMWAVGNEVDTLTNNSVSIEIDMAINKVAEYIKAVDPYHPITTVHAGSSSIKIAGVKNYAPCIDVVSANVYMGIENAYSNIITSAGWQGPYMITEYSTNQPSEVLKYEANTNSVFDGIVIEKTTEEKADDYYNRYQSCIYANKNKCIGSFAFAAYDTYRGTHTWYNIFLDDDYKTTPVYDALYHAWRGRERENPAPLISDITLGGRTASQAVVAKSGGSAVIHMNVSSADMLTYKYEVRPNDMDSKTDIINTAVFEQDAEKPTEVKVSNLPEEEGIYRLYVYAYDTHGNVGYGNIPFRISANDAEVNICGVNTLAREYFENISALGSSYLTPLSEGFKDTWKNSSSLMADSTMSVSEMAGRSMAVSTPNSITQNIFNVLNTPIDMSSDNVYYGRWIQGYNASNSINSYVKTGFMDENSNEISSVFMFRKTDIAPVMGIKAGTAMSYSDIYVNRGSLYNVYMKIQSCASGNDIISVKVWSLDMQEPKEWTYQTEAELNGEFSKIFFQSNPSGGSRAYFGEFSLERYSVKENELIDSAYMSIKNYLEGSGQCPDADKFPVRSGIVYKSLTELINMKDKAYIKEFYPTQEGNRISNLSEENKGISVVAVFANDNFQAAVYGNNIYAGIYDNEDKLISACAVNSGISIDNSENIMLNFDNADFSDGYIKVFVWTEAQCAVQRTYLINSSGVINY